MIAMIDYDAGNIKSVEKALQKLGAEVVITKDPEVILSAEKVILPGVGAFGDAMERLQERKLVETIREAVRALWCAPRAALPMVVMACTTASMTHWGFCSVVAALSK